MKMFWEDILSVTLQVECFLGCIQGDVLFQIIIIISPSIGKIKINE